MWIYTKEGFYSAVEDRFDPNTLIVRARVAGDLERLWPDADVLETPDADYRYRAALSRQEVAAAVAKAVLGIDYGNFKDSISDKRRKSFYMMVWHAMFEMQAALMVKRKSLRRRR